MDFPAIILEAETRLKAADISIDTFCKRVDIHRATWQRWKAGITEPRMRTWGRVEGNLPKEDANE